MLGYTLKENTCIYINIYDGSELTSKTMFPYKGVLATFHNEGITWYHHVSLQLDAGRVFLEANPNRLGSLACNLASAGMTTSRSCGIGAEL